MMNYTIKQNVAVVRPDYPLSDGQDAAKLINAVRFQTGCTSMLIDVYKRQLFSGLGLEVAGGERVALIGDNGSGKTTLLKMILGEEVPDSGRVRMGPTVKVGYLPQHVHFDHPERSLVDTLIYAQDCTAQSARNRLAAFKFRGEDVFKPVSALSGGEQSRLRLCMPVSYTHLDVYKRQIPAQSIRRG